MAIQFQCPHCKRPLKVRDEWAGKKARCPACQKLLTINASGAVDVEAMAAAAFHEESAAAPVQQSIDFRCVYCDEPVHVSADLAGKQTPCPECKRIIKVPLPKPTGPADWRQVNRLPSGARRDVGEAPEGAWGTQVSSGRVSAEALVEAKAIPVMRRPRTVRERIVLWTGVVIAVAMIVGGAIGMVNYQRRVRQEQALTKAEQALAGKGLPVPAGIETADLYRASGEYHLRDGDIQMAYDRFKTARARLAAHTDKVERDFLVMDLALSQAELLGDADAVRKHTRWGWQDTREELRRTLQLLDAPQARAAAIRQVGRKLLGIRSGLRIDELVNAMGKENERPELLGVAGLEMMRAGQKDQAKDVARLALAPAMAKPKNPKDPTPKLIPAASLIALLIALDQQADAEKYIGPVPASGEMPAEIRAGYALGWALVGRLEEARTLAKRPGGLDARFWAQVGVGESVAEKDAASAAADASAAVHLLSEGLDPTTLPPWLVIRFLALGMRTGALRGADTLLPALERPAVRRRVELEGYRLRFEQPGGSDMDAMARAAKEDSPDPLLLETLARLNARSGNAPAVSNQVGSWQPTSLQPFGYMGVALGLQDGKK